MFFRARYFMFIRYAAFHLQQLSAKRQRDSTEQKSIEANKENETKESKNDKENEPKKSKRDNKSQEKEMKDKKQKKDKDAKKESQEDAKIDDKSIKGKVDDLLLNENYSDIDTDVAKKIVESITDSICSGDKKESDCKLLYIS